MISLNFEQVVSLKQFDVALCATMKSIGFKKSKQGRVFLKRINIETQGIIIYGLSGNVRAGCLVLPMIGVINDRVEAMHRRAQAAVNYPAWMEKSITELNSTIQTELHRLVPVAELEELTFVKGGYERDEVLSRWAFKSEDPLQPLMSHLLRMIESYALPFMESLTDCQRIYEAFITGRVWLSPIERTTKCNNPFVLFLSGREEEAYEIVEQRMLENLRLLELPRQPSSVSDDGRSMTIFPSKDILDLDIQYDRAVLREFDSLLSN